MLMKNLLRMCGLFFALSILASAPLSLRAETPDAGLPFDGESTVSADISALNLNCRSFSASAWVKLKEVSASQIILNTGKINTGFTFYLYNGAIRFLIGQNDKREYAYALAPIPEKEVWTHYLGTYDGETIRLYRNGELAGAKKAETEFEKFDSPIFLGSGISARELVGALDDVAVWNRPLSAEEAKKVYDGSSASAADGLTAVWNAQHGEKNGIPGAPALERKQNDLNPLLNQKDVGYRSIWYYNQKLQNEYKYKYSGGLGTYPANHYPFSVYCPKVNKTFFCYGGTDPETGSTLWHEAGCFDNATGKVTRPTIIIDKETDDAHDNPVMTVDDDGYIWIFSTSHGGSRPSWIHRSKRPFDISEFELMRPTKIKDGQEVPMTNFCYMQVFNVPGKGMVAFFTTYGQSAVFVDNPCVQRVICVMTSRDGVHWSEWKPLAAIDIGHYQNGAVYKDQKIGTSFNYHPNKPEEGRLGLNWRTNLYYMESADMGETWTSVTGERIDTPLKKIDNPALVYDYDSQKINVYIVDMAYDNQGFPIILYITSKGFESGPENDPRFAWTAHWNGKTWDIAKVCAVDNNYDYGSIFVDEDGVWRIIGALNDGPQKYNTGGEMGLWVSRDAGKTWAEERKMTENSERNHCFPRRTINAAPGFYAFWADGNGREPSEADLFFSNRDGDVFKLPRKMTEDEATPEKVSP